jgi:23S rRNA (uracil1939-C5)-methyltransferase
VIPIAECPIAAPLLVKAALAFAEVARTFAPALRLAELALFCDRDETALLASVFVANAAQVRFGDFAKACQERIPELKGAELIAEIPQKGRTAPSPPRTIAQWGDAAINYRAAGFDYRVDHGSFFQVNRWLVDPLVECVTANRNGERVIAVESAPAATQALAANLKGTAGEAVHASTLDFLRRNRSGKRPDLIIVDPPRTGLGPDITAWLIESATTAITYVSCDPATLARDLRALLTAGYRMDSVTLTDLFPQTFHLETVVHLRQS